MSDLLTALLLGLIEGLTEFLPISSTGHLLIAQHWLGARSDLFNIVVQAGAILAICLVYRERLWRLLTGIRQQENLDYALKIGLAFGVTAAAGIPVRLAGWELPETVTPVAWALIIGGIWMLLAERLAERRPGSAQVTWTVAALVGLAQVVAGVFPGTSRSAAASSSPCWPAPAAGRPRPSSCSWSAFPPWSRPAPMPALSTSSPARQPNRRPGANWPRPSWPRP